MPDNLFKNLADEAESLALSITTERKILGIDYSLPDQLGAFNPTVDDSQCEASIQSLVDQRTRQQQRHRLRCARKPLSHELLKLSEWIKRDQPVNARWLLRLGQGALEQLHPACLVHQYCAYQDQFTCANAYKMLHILDRLILSAKHLPNVSKLRKVRDTLRATLYQHDHSK